MADNAEEPHHSDAEDTAPQNKGVGPDGPRGARPVISQEKPANPPEGESGVTLSDDGSR